ncbi:MAG: hypothetical protein OXD42_14415 [Rhodospirillaceae bacterium]|nr:hypothetical protein [Rhodospirillaceae bacterium]
MTRVVSMGMAFLLGSGQMKGRERDDARPGVGSCVSLRDTAVNMVADLIVAARGFVPRLSHPGCPLFRQHCGRSGLAHGLLPNEARSARPVACPGLRHAPHPFFEQNHTIDVLNNGWAGSFWYGHRGVLWMGGPFGVRKKQGFLHPEPVDMKLAGRGLPGAPSIGIAFASS